MGSQSQLQSARGQEGGLAPALFAFLYRLAALIAVVAFAPGCSTPKKPANEAAPQPPLAQATAPASPIAQSAPPELAQVKDAVKRVFKDSVMVDTSRQSAFVVGDFNGDQSQDVAVVVTPVSEKLSELNEEFPNWILRDLGGATSPGSPRLRVAADDVLLAVIHGYGANGWRDREATQTFLLKNAAGTNLEAHSANDVPKTHRGNKLPGLRGDVLAEVVAGKPGFVYYRMSSYAWYDPQTFTGEPEPRRGHGMAKK